MKKEQQISIISLFNRALPSNEVSYNEVNGLAVKLGYIVHPDCCSFAVLDFLNQQQIDYSSTFYKQWDDVVSKSRTELYYDQIRHYASTYGTDFQGEVWLPSGESTFPDFTKYKVILPITIEEVQERCRQMLYSGIALAQKTIVEILPLCGKIDVELVKNKEVKMMLHKERGTFPCNDNNEFVRFLVYLATGKTLLIKDKKTIDEIKASELSVSGMMVEYGLANLAESFNRYKPIFLAFKKKNAKAINLLSKLSKTCHKPMKAGYFETLLDANTVCDVVDLSNNLKTLNNFKKVLLLQTINIRRKGLDMQFYGIRNGKLWAKEAVSKYLSKYDTIYAIVYRSLVDSIREKATTVTLPKGVDLKIPTSEKSFIGNYPLGTSFSFDGGDCVVGINWKGVDGARDLDLKLIDIAGTQHGWNANFTNSANTVVFSGDMTNAYPEATELFYAKNGFTPSVVKVNLYFGDSGSKFKMFIARERIVDMKANYMVDPNNILFSVESEMDSKEKMLGVLYSDKFVLAQFRTGNKIVAGDSITNKYIDRVVKTMDCYLSLEQVLTDAGFVIQENGKLDLSNPSKDSLIGLFA